MAAAKRCVCGRSARLPLCDGAHEVEGWRCSIAGAAAVPYAFVAGRSLTNLADRLAHRFAGVSLDGGADSAPVTAERLVILSDGHDLARVRRLALRVQAGQTWVLGVDAPAGVLSWAFPDGRHVALAAEPAALIWNAAEAALTGGAAVTAPPDPARRRPAVFLSHAAADEATLFPVIEALRDHLGLSLFVCADSIAPGAGWHAEIRRELLACDLFVFVSSERGRASVFCAFEAGMALALDKPLRIVALDETPLPAHLQHIQSMEVGRLRRRKPWLTTTEAHLEAFLQVLGAAVGDGPHLPPGR